jgi:hypothetical protein
MNWLKHHLSICLVILRNTQVPPEERCSVGWSSLLVLQPCVGLGLLHDPLPPLGPRGFVTVDFVRGGVVSPTPNLEDQGLHFVWPLPYDMSGLDGPTGAYAPASIALRATGVRRPPLHDKALVLEEARSRVYHPQTRYVFILLCPSL